MKYKKRQSAVTAGFFCLAAAVFLCAASAPAAEASETDVIFSVGGDYESAGTEEIAAALAAQGIPSADVSGLIYHDGTEYVQIDTKPENETVYIPALDKGNGYIYVPTAVPYNGGVYTALYLDENASGRAALAYASIAMPVHKYRDGSGAVAYCLNRPFAYPEGIHTIVQDCMGSSKLTAQERGLVQNVIENGYPLNSEYWTVNGYTEDAQEYGTQLAIWCVLKAASGNDSAAYDLLYSEKAVNVTGMDVIGMVRTLYRNAVNGTKLYAEPAVTVVPEGLSYVSGRLAAEYHVEAAANSGFAVRVLSEAAAADTVVKCNGTVLTADLSGYFTVENETEGTIRVSVPADTRGSIRIEVCPRDTRGSASIWWTEDTGSGTQDMAVVRCAVSLDSGASAFASTPLPTAEISITKTAEGSGKAVAGAVYGLYTTTMRLVETFPETDETGRATVAGLPLGVYLIKEISSPPGYILSEQPVLIEAFDTGAADGQIVAVSVELREAATAVSVLKTDESGQTVSGAALRITAKQEVIYNGRHYLAGETVAEWVSSEAAYVIEALPAGEYTLEELSAPFGYALAPPVDFTVSEETAQIQHITMTDNRIYGRILIKKTDSITGGAVEGAEFTLICNEAEGCEGLPPFTVKAVTDEKGEAVMEQIPIGIYGAEGVTAILTYTLYETKTPPGYLTPEAVTLAFVWEDDGCFRYAQGELYELTRTAADGIAGIDYIAEIAEEPEPPLDIPPLPEPEEPSAAPPLGSQSAGNVRAAGLAAALALFCVVCVGCIRKSLFSLTNRVW